MRTELLSEIRGKRVFGRERRCWKNNIKKCLKGTWLNVVDWIQLVY